MLLLEQAIKYAKDVIAGEEITTWEVKKQCEIFINDYEHRQYEEGFEFYFDEKKLRVINDLLKLINFATGFVAGKQVLENLAAFQCFFIANIFGWRYKDKPYKFRYNDNTLFISRKNAKTALIAIVFILLMLTEQRYSEFYSICLTKELSAEIKKAMEQILGASPLIKKRFKISTTKTGSIKCLLTGSYFEPRTAESGKNNSIRPSAFVSDEHANFSENSNFNAMKSGQKNVLNGLVFRTTTAYTIDNSIMEEDLAYIRSVLKGELEDERQFALIYYADEEHLWDDYGLYQANPLRVEENYDTMRKDRAIALVKDSVKEEFLTKTMNVFLSQDEFEKYLDVNYFKKGALKEIDFGSKEVVVSLDLSLTTDLTAVDIMFKEDGKYYLKAIGFLPEESLKKRREKFDYRQAERRGECIITPGAIVDYGLVENYIRNIEGEFNCKIRTIIADPYNATQMLLSLSEDYEVIELKQTYVNLSPPTKEFRNEVYNGNIFYVNSKLLEFNVSNAITRKDRNENEALDKANKNKQRIDLLAAAIFAFSECFKIDEDFVVQTA